jgi:hypothetical protein
VLPAQLFRQLAKLGQHVAARLEALPADPVRVACALETVKVVISMSSYPDLHSDFEKLTADAAQMADENARLRKTNAQMLAALQYALPILQQGLPETVNFDWTKEAIDKVQNAIAEAAGD